MRGEVELVVEVSCSEPGETPILRTLLRSGWRLGGANGHILYLEPDDGGRFEWKSVPEVQWPLALEQGRRAAASGQVLGVSAVWKSTGVGGTFRIEEPTVCCFDPDPSRPERSGYNDVNWFLSRILRPLEDANFSVRRWSWREDYD